MGIRAGKRGCLIIAGCCLCLIRTNAALLSMKIMILSDIRKGAGYCLFLRPTMVALLIMVAIPARNEFIGALLFRAILAYRAFFGMPPIFQRRIGEAAGGCCRLLSTFFALFIMSAVLPAYHIIRARKFCSIATDAALIMNPFFGRLGDSFGEAAGHSLFFAATGIGAGNLMEAFPIGDCILRKEGMAL